MSRTDKHALWRVKERDPAWARFFTPSHDHRTGPCDLAEWMADPRYEGRCQMQINGRRVNISCGCQMCTGSDAVGFRHRHARTAWRTESRRLRAYARAGQPQHPDIEPHRNPHREGPDGFWGREQPGQPVTVFTAQGEVPYRVWLASRKTHGAGGA